MQALRCQGVPLRHRPAECSSSGRAALHPAIHPARCAPYRPRQGSPARRVAPLQAAPVEVLQAAPSVLQNVGPTLLQTVIDHAGDAHPGLITAAAINTAVFTAGIKILLKGLTPAGTPFSRSIQLPSNL